MMNLIKRFISGGSNSLPPTKRDWPTLRECEDDKFKEESEDYFCRQCNHKILDHETFYGREAQPVKWYKRRCAICFKKCKSDWVGTWMHNAEKVIKLDRFESDVMEAKFGSITSSSREKKDE